MVWYLQFWPPPSSEKYPKQEQKYPQNITKNGPNYDITMIFPREADIWGNIIIIANLDSAIWNTKSLKS